MKFVAAAVLLALGILGPGLGTAQASDFVGVYALIDKVTLEPSADHPERIQISGVFAMAKPDDRNYYLAPQRGYLYFTLPTDRKDLALREWSDLKASAGTHMVVSFGDRAHLQMLKVRKTDEKPGSPDVYPLGFGLTRNRSDTDYSPVKSLLEYR